MTSEAMKIIAEAEGVRTPTRKRSKKEVETTINEFTEKRKASKSKAKAAKSAKAGTSAKKPVSAKNADQPAKAVRSTGAVADIKRIAVVGQAGNVRSAGYDEKGSRLQIEFDKSIWEYPNTTADEWKGLKASLTDKDSDTGAYFRKAFRGRASSSKRVYDRSTEGASKEAPASAEVK